MEALKNKFSNREKGVYLFQDQKLYMLDCGTQRVMNPPSRIISIMTSRGRIDDSHSPRNPQYIIMEFGDAIRDGKEIDVLYLTENIKKRSEVQAGQGYVDPWA
jgi:hypothetical protein